VDEDGRELLRLFARMRTRETEIAATVHFAATEFANERDDVPSEQDGSPSIPRRAARCPDHLARRLISACRADHISVWSSANVCGIL
jgi:hypothetical protein